MRDKLPTVQPWCVGLLLCIAAIATYWPVTKHEFINYDDPVYVTDNPHVQAGLTPESVIWAFTTSRSGNWHPLTWLSLMLDSELFGDWPGGFHLTNVLFHTANTLLLFLLLRAMTGALWRSAFVAALFALHPLHVESVAWVAERKDVLSTFFGLLCLLSYAKFATAPVTNSPTRKRYYWLAFGLFALGLMSKPMLVTWPFVMLLLDYWPLDRIKLGKSGQIGVADAAAAERSSNVPTTPASRVLFWNLVVEKMPFFALTLLMCVVTIFTQRQTDAIASLHLIPLVNRLAQMPVSYARYLGKTFWPENLAVFYPYELIGWDSPTPYLAALLLVIITLGALVLARRWPYLLTGWLWYLGTLVPVIGIVQVGRQSIADRYTYIPLIGLFVVFAWGVAQLVTKWRSLRWGIVPACVLAVIAASIATRHQLRYWHNSTLLFQRALSVTKLNEVAHNNLGAALMEKGDFENARPHFEAALQINPANQWARMNLGFVMVKTGDVQQGLAQLRNVVAAWPTAVSHYFLGIALLETENCVEAADHLRAAVKLRPDFFHAHLFLGAALRCLDNHKDAVQHLATAVKLRPHHPDALFNLASALTQLNRFNEAVTTLLAYIRLRPEDLKARRLLADVALKEQHIEVAITNMAELVRLQPDADTAFDLAQLLVQFGRADAAMPYYRIALELNPDWPKPYNNLALILATHPDHRIRNGPEAVTLAERACVLTEWKIPVYLSTLAAAYAEAGKFDEAVRTAEKAVTLAEMAAQTNLARRNAELLQLYRTGKPFHDHTLTRSNGAP